MRQNAVAVVIGMSEYRDGVLSPIPEANRDAETIARYMTSALGVPAERVRTLTNERALKADLVETFEDWLPRQVKSGGIVAIYVAGGVRVTGAGAVHVLPYEGGGGVQRREYPLRRLYDVLAALPAQRILLMLDVALIGPGPGIDDDAQWGPLPAALRDGRLVHIVRVAGDPRTRVLNGGRHGALTTALLTGLRGAADVNRDHAVTIGELCRYVTTDGAERSGCVPAVAEHEKAAAFSLARLRE